MLNELHKLAEQVAELGPSERALLDLMINELTNPADPDAA